MATTAGRKKSIISTISNGAGPGGIQIEQPVANNSLLNKQASTTTGLYQRCSKLRARLLRIAGFAHYFAAASPPESARQSTDPVTQMWDLLALGIPLAHLWNLLPNPPYAPIPIDVGPDALADVSIQVKKRAIALFCIRVQTQMPQCDLFTVTELLSDRATTDGFVKVISTVSVVVDLLPDDVFTEAPSSPPPSLAPTESTESLATLDSVQSMPPNAQEAARNHIVREIVETERKYVQDLELMQRYAQALSTTIDQDTIHHLFPNLNKLLNFQRKFLIRFEGIVEQPWRDQRWGLPFIENEEDFAVYEPYCANYTHAADLMLQEEQNLTTHNELINAKSELPAFLIKPVQRICKYPLLLDSLIKATSGADYPHSEELKEGTAAAKRITDKINEAQRRAENKTTVKHLEARVEDWKGHHLSNFGDLLVDDIFVVTKSDVDREYHVFLFEKIILCCKELLQPPPSARKVGKTNSILKKQQPPPALTLPGGVGPPKQKNTPLLLKGRIFLSNVTQAVPDPRARPGEHALAVWWSGEDDLEFFTLRCRTEEQYNQWQSQINRLIKEIASRRASERASGLQKMANHGGYNSTSPALTSARSQGMYPSPGAMNGMPSSRSTGRTYGGPEDGGYGTGPNGYPAHNGFDGEESDDLYEHYPPSGRNTAMSLRREASRSIGGWDDDSSLGAGSYRQSGYSVSSPPLPPAVPNGLPNGPAARSLGRPSISRLPSTASAASGASYGSDSSFGAGPGAGPLARPTLRSKFSTTRLQPAYEAGEGAHSHASMPPAARQQAHAPSRSRSASQPSAYVPKAGPAPPLPTNAPWGAGHERSPSTVTAQQAYPGAMQQQQQKQSAQGKRGSGSSQSTAASSADGYSPNSSSSPITPYGSGDSSNGAFEVQLVKVKVHYHEDIFVIQVPFRLEYADLLEKVAKKIRLCTGKAESASLRMRYQDEDGDMVSLTSTEDVQMAFEPFRPGGQVIIYVS